MNPLFEELLAQAPGQTPVMPVAPTVASTGGTVAQPLTPAGQSMANQVLHGLMFPGNVALEKAQVFDDQGHTTDEAVHWATDRALGGLRAASIPRTPVSPSEVAFGSGPIRAYHGSPHDFDRFDLSKIGTGEGAQAYGHGLYFAENPTTAQAYRDALEGRRGASFPPSIDHPDSLARSVLDAAGGDRDQAITALKQRLNSYLNTDPRYQAPDFYDRAMAAMQTLQSGKQLPGGKMYEVAIHADPERFLDWDKPLIANPKPVRDAIGDIARQYGATPDMTIPGSEAYRSLASNLAPQEIPSLGVSVKAGAPEASRVLNDAGVPGLRYLDQGSRGLGDGSGNLVTFNDKIVEIMRKYGVASFAALPPAVQMMLQRGQTETPAGNGGLGGLGGYAPRA